MTTGNKDELYNRTAIPKFYDSNKKEFIFEIFTTEDLTVEGPFFKYLDLYENDEDPNSNILIIVTNQGTTDLNYINFMENRNFSILPTTFFGYEIASNRYTNLFTETIVSGINDFIPPRTQKTLVYDFKFTNNSSNYSFVSNDGLLVDIARVSSQSPVTTSGERSAY